MPEIVKKAEEVVKSTPSKVIWGLLTLGLGPSLAVISTAVLGSFSAMAKLTKHTVAHFRRNMTSGNDLIFNPTWDAISDFFKNVHSKAIGLSFFGWKKGSDLFRDAADSLQNELGQGSTAHDEDDQLDRIIKSKDRKRIQQSVDDSITKTADEIYYDVASSPMM